MDLYTHGRSGLGPEVSRCDKRMQPGPPISKCRQPSRRSGKTRRDVSVNSACQGAGGAIVSSMHTHSSAVHVHSISSPPPITVL